MSARRRAAVKYLLLLTAAAFIAVGVSRGESASVLAKAAAVCLECIGIG